MIDTPSSLHTLNKLNGFKSQSNYQSKRTKKTVAIPSHFLYIIPSIGCIPQKNPKQSTYLQEIFYDSDWR